MVRKASHPLTHGMSYPTDLNKTTVRIDGVGKIPIMAILGISSFYKDWQLVEARFVLRDGKAYVHKGSSPKGLKGTGC